MDLTRIVCFDLFRDFDGDWGFSVYRSGSLSLFEDDYLEV
jgi:hypothetical protein